MTFKQALRDALIVEVWIHIGGNGYRVHTTKASVNASGLADRLEREVPRGEDRGAGCFSGEDARGAVLWWYDSDDRRLALG